jgi:osomolarity two-component system response regulator SKN7
MQPGSPFSNLIESPSASDGATSANPATGLTSGRSTPGFLNFGGTYDGEINPLAGMGLTDDQYTLILQNMVNGDGFLSMMDEAVITGSMEKRSLEDLGEDGRNKKRSRFETIE